MSADHENLVNGVETLIPLDTIPAGYTDGIENVVTHRITPGVAGFYSIHGQARLFNTVAAKCYSAQLRVSGVVKDYFYAHAAASTFAVTVSCHFESFYLSAVNYLELWVMSDAGVDTVDVGKIGTYLEVQKVR